MKPRPNKTSVNSTPMKVIITSRTMISGFFFIIAILYPRLENAALCATSNVTEALRL